MSSFSEEEIRRILMVRAIEEADSERLPLELRDEARVAAGSLEGEGQEVWLARRASFILDRLARPFGELAHATLPPGSLGIALLASSLLVGGLTNSLGPPGRIHAFFNPMMALIAWNLGVYALMLVRVLRRQPGVPETRTTLNADPRLLPRRPLGRGLLLLQALLSGLGERLLGWLRRLRAAAPAEIPVAVRSQYLAEYARIGVAPILARAERLLGLGSIAFALGTLAGMYVRGVGYRYNAVWLSTLIESPETGIALIRTLFWPAWLVLGAHFPDAASVQRLASPEGVRADIWLHVYAISATVYILIPRTALLFWHTRRVRRLGARVELDLGEAYWRTLLERTFEARPEQLDRMLLRDFGIDAAGSSVLASLQAALIEEDIRNTRVGRLSLRDPLAAKKRWYADWRALVERGFAAFPEGERPRILKRPSAELDAAIQGTLASPNRFAAELILLELAAFEAYWPLSPPKAVLGRWLRWTPSLDRDIQQRALEAASEALGLPAGTAAELRAELRTCTNALSSYWLRVGVGAVAGATVGVLTFGIAAPFIGGLLGSVMALSGVAAIEAALAALGGGALAAGGIAAGGGTTILVGGGALLGLGFGSSAASRSSGLSAGAALLPAAKIDVVLRRIVVERHADTERFARVLARLAEVAGQLREELPELRLAPDATHNDVRERERVVDLLETEVERLRRFASRRGIPSTSPS